MVDLLTLLYTNKSELVTTSKKNFINKKLIKSGTSKTGILVLNYTLQFFWKRLPTVTLNHKGS